MPVWTVLFASFFLCGHVLHSVAQSDLVCAFILNVTQEKKNGNFNCQCWCMPLGFLTNRLVEEHFYSSLSGKLQIEN